MIGSNPFVPQWLAPCPACNTKHPQPYQTTDIVQFVDAGDQFQCRYKCQCCRAMLAFMVAPEWAIWMIQHGAHLVKVSKVQPEPHAGGPTITEDDQIDFALAWEPGDDETQDQVWERVWTELMGSTQSKEVQEE